MKNSFQATGTNKAALFTLKIHRGEGMVLLAMNWKKGTPPNDFVGFGIEYKEPDGEKFFALKNRVSFAEGDGNTDGNKLSTLVSPIQKFRWVHFPRNAEFPGKFTYRVTPIFMNSRGELSQGEPQQAALELLRETYPGQLNVAFTRGFVSSQAFVDRFVTPEDPLSKLLPPNADEGLDFKPTHSKTDEALAWMGFEARHAILELLSQAIADENAQVSVVAYDLSEPEVVERLEKLGSRLKIIIDDEGAHSKPDSGETQAERRLVKTAGRANVKRQHMGQLQHNKTIVVNGPRIKGAVCGSTNYTWRGFYVQANNAIVVRGENAIQPFLKAFDNYWNNNTPASFGKTDSATFSDLGLKDIDAKISFSPHLASNALLDSIAADVKKANSSLFYSLAFLYQTPGAILNAIKAVTADEKMFVYGISDKKVGGIELQKPNGKVMPVFPTIISPKDTPEPFKSEPTGGGGNRLHHKFLVIDFDKPSARVYMGSYNFSSTADLKNGDNLMLIKDRRIAVAYMIEALRLFDHYHFRIAQQEAKKARKKLTLAKPPANQNEKPWWDEYYSDPRKVRDRELFS